MNLPESCQLFCMTKTFQDAVSRSSQANPIYLSGSRPARIFHHIDGEHNNVTELSA
jgi:hypothetical protein